MDSWDQAAQAINSAQCSKWLFRLPLSIPHLNSQPQSPLTHVGCGSQRICQ